MKKVPIQIIILIVSLILVFTGDRFNICDNDGKEYPIGFLIRNDTSYIYKVGFNYSGKGLIYYQGINGDNAKDYPYYFQDNEFINYMKVCTAQTYKTYIVVNYIHIRTNINNNFYYG